MPGMRDRGRRRARRPGAGEASRSASAWRWSRARWLFFAVAAVAAAFLLLPAGSQFRPPSRAQRAVIVDQLSLTAPNPRFVASATDLLRRDGYDVDYVPGEAVTVDFLRTLPERDYQLIILRAHSGTTNTRTEETGELREEEYVSLFSGQPYDAGRYIYEQRTGRVGPSAYLGGAHAGTKVFGIGPRFVSRSMQGRFDGAVIVMMGCGGMQSPVTAQPFLDRGAAAFVGWDDLVSAEHTDAATERLLGHLAPDRSNIVAAVDQTAAEAGPDPGYGAELRVVTAGQG